MTAPVPDPTTLREAEAVLADLPESWVDYERWEIIEWAERAHTVIRALLEQVDYAEKELQMQRECHQRFQDDTLAMQIRLEARIAALEADLKHAQSAYDVRATMLKKESIRADKAEADLARLRAERDLERERAHHIAVTTGYGGMGWGSSLEDFTPAEIAARMEQNRGGRG